jgi:hypothetical protein
MSDAEHHLYAGRMSDAERTADTEQPSKPPTPSDCPDAAAPLRRAPGRRAPGQLTAQILSVGATVNRDLAEKLCESPKLVLTAAVLAFELLDSETQVAMIVKARAAHAAWFGRCRETTPTPVTEAAADAAATREAAAAEKAAEEARAAADAEAEAVEAEAAAAKLAEARATAEAKVADARAAATKATAEAAEAEADAAAADAALAALEEAARPRPASRRIPPSRPIRSHRRKTY